MAEADRIFDRLSERRRAFGSFDPHVTSGPRNWAKHYEENGYRFYRAQDIGAEGDVLADSKVFISPPPGEQGRSAMLQPWTWSQRAATLSPLFPIDWRAWLMPRN